MDAHTLHIQQALGIDYSLAEEIKAICRPVRYAAKTIVQRSGVVDTKAIFLQKGVCKYSVFDKQGNEYVSRIDGAERFLAYGYFGFYRREKAVANFIAITEIEGLEVSADNFMPIVDRNPELYTFFVDSVIRRFMKIQSKEVSIIQKSSTERYQDFRERYKDVIHDIPLKDIASYLSIQPGSLSRIRKNLSS